MLRRRAARLACLTALVALSGCESPKPLQTPLPSPPRQTISVAVYPSDGPKVVQLAVPTPFVAAPLTRFGKAGIVAPGSNREANWMLPPYEGDSWYGSGRLEAAGDKAAVVRLGRWLFGVHQSRGLVGPLTLPERVFWLGLDGADTLFAATPEGTLYRMRDLAGGADPLSYQPIVQIPTATAWDVTEGLIVAGAQNYVLASLDQGTSFRATALPKGQVVSQVAARYDGVVVVVSHENADARRPSVWISADRGWNFQASTFVPRSIVRKGGQIRGQLGACYATLSSDGKTWGYAPGDSHYQLNAAWERMVRTQDKPGYIKQEAFLTVRKPDIPFVPDAALQVGADGKCPEEKSGKRGGGGGGNLLGIGGLGSMGGSGSEGILGVAGLPFPVRRRSARQWSFLSDGMCHPDDMERSRVNPSCKGQAAPPRFPRMLQTDERDLTQQVRDVPDGCTPEQVINMGGTAVLSCAGKPHEHTIYLAGPDGRWYAEGSLTCDMELRAGETSADGGFSLLCGMYWSGRASLWVRKPAPLGEPGAFRSVEVKDAVTYRLLEGGKVFAITTKGKRDTAGGLGAAISLTGPALKRAVRPAKPITPKVDEKAEDKARHTFSVVLCEPATPDRVVAQDVVVKDDVKLMLVDGGELYLRTDGKGGKVGYGKIEKGRLKTLSATQVPAALKPAVVDQKTALVGYAISGAPRASHSLVADATHVYTTDWDVGQIVKISRGGAVDVLARDLTSPAAVGLDESRVYFTTLGMAYGDSGSVGMVSKTGGPITWLAEGLFRPLALLVDSSSVYILDQGLGAANGTLYKFSKQGGAPQRLLERLVRPRTMALAEGRVVVGHAMGEVFSVSTAGGPPLPLGVWGDGVSELVLSGDKVIWSGGTEPILATAALSGGGASWGARLTSSASAIFSLGADVWTVGEFSGTLAKTTLGRVGATAVKDGLLGPTALWVDESGIYVRENDGARVSWISADGAKTKGLYERR
ncbi:MAG: hypothetical protein IPK82_26815 [Polyangiaceae bacterium]|nr:hypothetical protein [Polyangiaceae bacterium]